MNTTKPPGSRRPSRRAVAAVAFAGALLLGIFLALLAGVPETSLEDVRTFGGSVPPLAEGGDALLVPDASYTGLGFAEASTSGLACGVGIVFLDNFQWQDFLESGRLPAPQLHCDRSSAQLPGSVAAVLVENQRLNASTWEFELRLYAVSHPYSLYGLPATALLLAGGLGLTALIFQRSLLGWLEEGMEGKKKE